MSPKLYEILERWNTLRRRGDISDRMLKMGLCAFVSRNGTSQEVREFDRLLEADFGEDALHPFNRDELDYYNEPDKTKNPKRIAWVENKLAEG